MARAVIRRSHRRRQHHALDPRTVCSRQDTPSALPCRPNNVYGATGCHGRERGSSVDHVPAVSDRCIPSGIGGEVSGAQAESISGNTVCRGDAGAQVSVTTHASDGSSHLKPVCKEFRSDVPTEEPRDSGHEHGATPVNQAAVFHNKAPVIVRQRLPPRHYYRKCPFVQIRQNLSEVSEWDDASH